MSRLLYALTCNNSDGSHLVRAVVAWVKATKINRNHCLGGSDQILIKKFVWIKKFVQTKFFLGGGVKTGLRT